MPNVKFRRAPVADANLAGVYRVAWNAGLGWPRYGERFPYLLRLNISHICGRCKDNKSVTARKVKQRLPLIGILRRWIDFLCLGLGYPGELH